MPVLPKPSYGNANKMGLPGLQDIDQSKPEALFGMRQSYCMAEGSRMIFAWTFVIVGAFIGAFVAIQGWRVSRSPEEFLSTAALALCFVVIPYCVARAVEGITGSNKARTIEPAPVRAINTQHCPACGKLIDRRQSQNHCGECGAALA